MAQFDKKRILRELERDRRAAARKRLAELRTDIKKAREHRRLAVRAVREQCKAARLKLREARARLRTRCLQRAELARGAGDADLRERRRILAEERAYEQALRGESRRPATRATARERRSESDDAVRADLPSELVPVFDRVRRHIKGGPRKTRAEAFLEWVEDNTDEVARMQSDQAEHDVRRMVAEHEKLERELARKKRRRTAGAEVPF